MTCKSVNLALTFYWHIVCVKQSINNNGGTNMTFDKYTIKAQEAVQAALQTAQSSGQQSVEAVHLLTGIISKGRDITNYVFQKLGVNSQGIDIALQQELQHLPVFREDNHSLAMKPLRYLILPRKYLKRWVMSLFHWNHYFWLS